MHGARWRTLAVLVLFAEFVAAEDEGMNDDVSNNLFSDLAPYVPPPGYQEVMVGN